MFDKPDVLTALFGAQNKSTSQNNAELKFEGVPFKICVRGVMADHKNRATTFKIELDVFSKKEFEIPVDSEITVHIDQFVQSMKVVKASKFSKRNALNPGKCKLTVTYVQEAK